MLIQIKQLHNQIKQKMQKKAELEEENQKKTELNRKKIFKEKIEKYEEYNTKKHEGEQRQLDKLEQIIKQQQQENEINQKFKIKVFINLLKMGKLE